MNTRRLVLALALALGLATSAHQDASAWAPIATSRPVWRGAVPYSMNNAGSPDLGVAMSEMIVRTGMDDWTRIACTSLTTDYRGQTATRPVGGDGQSVVGWVESGWEHGSGAIGVTGPRWSTNIVEADMELNGVDYTWITGGGSRNQVNAYSIIAHEGGHYYGLGHSSDAGAMMYYAYSGGTSTIGTDDQNGICALYPGSGSDCTTTGCPTGQECTGGTCVAITGDGTVCAPCSSGADCSGGACLGYPDGAGYCGRSCTTSAECGTDQCVSVTGAGGQCVRVQSGAPSCASGPSRCTSDAACSATQRCNTTTGACEARPTTGAALGEDCGTGPECASGLCFAGRCSQSCDWLTPTSCPGGWYCSGEATGSCSGSGVCLQGGAGGAALGDACGASTDCASLYCASGVCSQPCIAGGAAGCPEGLSCQVGAVAGCGSCQRSGTVGDPCEMNEDCTTRLCASLTGDGVCTDYCDADSPCPDGFSCLEAAPGVSVCAPDTGGLGTECRANPDCLSGICADEGDRRYCTRLCTDEPCPASFACIATDDPAFRVCRPISNGGCGCSTPGSTSGGARGALLALGLLAFALASRSRRRG